MALYSEKVMDHFRNPRNVGVIEDANAIGEVGNAKCGDIMKMYLKIEDDIVEDVKFETFGCGSAIASSSMATELIKGKPLSEAMNLTNKAVTEALDGLPAYKLHCSVLAEEAIQSALEDYYSKYPEKRPADFAARPAHDPHDLPEEDSRSSCRSLANARAGRRHDNCVSALLQYRTGRETILYAGMRHINIPGERTCVI